jgi:shikimate dehydrogenase
MPRQPSINGSTQLLAIAGDPVSHVRSPEIYNARLADAAHNAVLVAVHLREAEFEAGMRGLMSIANLTGIVVTYPFKERAPRFVRRLGQVGSQVGAINAMRRESDGSWTGDMFDGAGLLAAIQSLGHSVKGCRITLVGAGGAGSAIAMTLAGAGAASVRISDRLLDRAVALSDRVRRFYPDCAVTAGAPLIEGRDFLINATPAGMAPGFALAPFEGVLHPGLVVIDIVPSPEPTRLLEAAQAAGCPTVNGQAMIAGQADAVLTFFGFSRQ